MKTDDTEEEERSNEFAKEEQEVFKKEEAAKHDFYTFKKVKWVTAEMGKHFERDLYLIVHARETIFYFIFVACVTISALGLVDSRMYFMTQSLREHLKEQAGYPNPTLGDTSEVKFADIATVAEMWDYIENHFIKYLHAHSGSDQRKASASGTESKPTTGEKKPGRVRRQEPVADEKKDEKKEEKKDEKKDDKKETQTQPNETDGDMQLGADAFQDRGLGFENILVGRAVIRTVMVNGYECQQPFPAVFVRCYPPYSASVRRQEVSENRYAYQEQIDTQATGFAGKVSYYLGDGFQEKLGPTYEDTKATIARLKNGRYLTAGTRAVFLDASYYNPSVNLFCAIKFLFELPAGGGVVPSAYFYTVRLIRRVSITDYVMVAFELLFLLFIVFFIVEDIRSIAFVRAQYFRSLWNIVNIGIAGSSLCYFLLTLLQSSEIRHVKRLMRADINDYIGLQRVTQNELVNRNVLAVVLFLVYMKVFKFMSFNWTMTILNKTMKRCLNDVFAFVLMFIVMFMAFALFGALIFGTQIRHFSTLSLAMFALLRTMLGDFAYDEFEDAGKLMAPYYYLLYVFLVLFILLNMFLAIINDTYSDAKTELAIAVPERRVADFWNTGLYNLMSEYGCKACAPKGLVSASHINPSAEEIRDALKRCGYTDLDIDLFLGRYNIDPEAQVRVKDVSKLIAHMRIEGAKRHAPRMRRDRGTNQPPIIAIDDFLEQQDRLERVEVVMGTIVERLDLLLDKLLQFEGRKDTTVRRKEDDDEGEGEDEKWGPRRRY